LSATLQLALPGAVLLPNEFWLLGAALFGLCIGSFLNVVIHRLPQMMERAWRDQALETLGQSDPAQASRQPLNLLCPRSRCPQCGHVLHWHENIPVLGWLLLKGKCSNCGKPIGWRYPAVELATALLFALVVWHYGPTWTAVLYAGFAAALVALAGIDWDTTLLPDSLNQPLLWAGLVAAAMGWLPHGWAAAFWGAVAGYLFLWSVYWLFKLVTGKEGMGYGDFKLLAALGAWLGWPALLPVVLASSLIGAVVGIALKLSGGLREGLYLPFGPFLAGAGLVVALGGGAWLPRL
jgi:leader peptidase (prepilin peptidase)/N-methyltransferase